MIELVATITGLTIAVAGTDPPGLAIRVEGTAPTPGWTDFALEHPIYIALPADGIYEARMTGVPPDGPQPVRAVAFCHDETWVPFPADLKGLRVCSASNPITAMLA